MTTTKKRPRGSTIENPASKSLSGVRVTPDQLTTYKRAAKKAKLKFSKWVRMTLEKACK